MSLFQFLIFGWRATLFEVVVSSARELGEIKLAIICLISEVFYKKKRLNGAFTSVLFKGKI